MNKQQQYTDLVLQAVRHAHLYYECDAPEIEDWQYDRLYKNIRDMEESGDVKVVSYSPTQFVGFVPTSLQYTEVQHGSEH